MVGLLNLGSLVLGIIAWILPVATLMQYKKHHLWNRAVLSIMSISACAISLCFQMFNIKHLVEIEDWTALLDTAGTIAFVAAVLVIVTIILNVIIMIIDRIKTANEHVTG
jgi:hypothetical protein